MKKVLVITIAVVIILVIVAYFVSDKSSTTTTPVLPENITEEISEEFSNNPIEITQDSPITKEYHSNEEIKELVYDTLSSNMPFITTGSTTVEGNYALQIWFDENVGGESLLKYDTDKGWVVMSQGGGAWSVDTLIEQGVPKSVAEGLIENRGY